MSSNSASNQKIRLKQVPIDIWSIREKLCLASSVQRSGDQNCQSFSESIWRTESTEGLVSIKSICALQYEELLEMNEKEMPKRKRGERGEETAQDIIVRKLKNERIEELRKITVNEREMVKKMREDIESLRNNTIDEKRLKEMINKIKDEEKAEKEAEIERKKWLEEREVKILQMKATRGSLHANRQKAVIPATPVNKSLPSSIKTESAKSPLNEPLKVNIDSEPPTNIQTSALISTNENKLTLPLPTPSTSPLLTSLLQSPTPSTPTLLSPNKSGLSSTTFTRQTSLSQTQTVTSPTSLPSITRRPSIHSPEKVSALNSPEKSESVVSNPNIVSPVSNTNVSAQQINSQSSSPTLSKLLEIPLSTPGKIPPLPLIEAQVVHQKQEIEQMPQNKESEQTKQVEELKESLNSPSDDRETRVNSSIKSPTKLSHVKLDSETTDETRNEEEDQQLAQNTHQIDDSNIEKIDKTMKTSSVDLTDENRDTEKPINDNRVDESVESVQIKREIIEPIPEEEHEKEIVEKITIKEEPIDTTPNITAQNDSKALTSISTRAKRRKPVTPLTVNTTPTVTRRSGRVKALKDSKTTDDSTEVSDQSAANTPQAPKKRGSVDETTETSMSEESMDAKFALTAPLNESVPNSPASSIMQTEDTESLREYKIWKKAIMLVWRTASTHKNASLFLHPVTESDAEGYTDTVRRSMDLTTIKKRIESGVIRTTAEFQRDIMLMFQNAIMFNNDKHDVHKMAVEMQKETIASIEDFIETQQQNNQSNESKLRGRESRRSAAIAVNSPLITDNETSGRRKSRGASTDTDSGSTVQTKSAVKKKKP